MQTGYPCPYCGFTDHPEDANYCGKCGKEIKFIYNSFFNSCGNWILSGTPMDLSELRYPYEIDNYQPIFFEVRDNRDRVNLMNNDREKFYKIYNAQIFITDELKKSGKIFGGKSKTEILNQINDILS